MRDLHPDDDHHDIRWERRWWDRSHADGATPSGGTTGGGAGRGTPGSGSGSPSSPGVPSVVAPPRTGGGPLSGDTLPWPALLFFGVIGVGGTVALVRNRNARLRGAASVDH